MVYSPRIACVFLSARRGISLPLAAGRSLPLLVSCFSFLFPQSSFFNLQSSILNPLYIGFFLGYFWDILGLFLGMLNPLPDGCPSCTLSPLGESLSPFFLSCATSFREEKCCLLSPAYHAGYPIYRKSGRCHVRLSLRSSTIFRASLRGCALASVESVRDINTRARTRVIRVINKEKGGEIGGYFVISK